MRPDALISVALATYNGERYLAQQLDSIYAQTYPNLEVIVTDDGSCDRTIELLERYRQKYGLKYFINEKNLGYAKNFERAASLCSGDYISFCDQDDIFLPDRIETLVHEIGDYSLIYSDATLIDGEGNEFVSSYMRYVNFPMLTGKVFQELVFGSFIRGFQMLFTRELLHAALPMPDRVTHDDWFSILAAKRGGIKYLDRPLVQYRQHGRNVTGALVQHSMMRELAGIFRNLGSQKANECRRKCYFDIIEKLDGMLTSPAFNEKEKAFIAAVSTYYCNQFDSFLHWKSFSFALKYHRIVTPGKSIPRKIKFLMASLLHS